MTYSVSVQGVDELQSLLGSTEKEIARAIPNTLNAGITEFRRELVDDVHANTGLRKKRLRDAMRISRARGSGGYAKLTPSSEGVPITEYDWRQEAAGHPTRARILIRWFGGWKVSPGFVNPAMAKPVPLKTITSKGVLNRPVLAHGISVAAAFKVANNDKRMERYQWRIGEIFEEKLEDQMRRRT